LIEKKTKAFLSLSNELKIYKLFLLLSKNTVYALQGNICFFMVLMWMTEGISFQKFQIVSRTTFFSMVKIFG